MKSAPPDKTERESTPQKGSRGKTGLLSCHVTCSGPTLTPALDSGDGKEKAAGCEAWAGARGCFLLSQEKRESHWGKGRGPMTPQRAFPTTKEKRGSWALAALAGGAGCMFAEHMWKRKRGTNRPNECAGDNSSSSGRIISSLWFNMMIDHLCLPA